MCGRYTLFQELEEIDHFLNTQSRVDEYEESYNVAPTHEMPVAYRGQNGQNILEKMHWGFMGWKPKPGKRPFLPINTRDDSLTKKPMWTGAFLKRRCIVPASGFYEWTGSSGNKTPHYIQPAENGLLGFAGIYSDLSPEGKSSTKSYSIITTSPNKLMEPIHDRMPVILHPSEFDDWLNPGMEDPAYLKEFLRPYPDDALKEFIVSRQVGNVRSNHPGLVEKAELF